MTNLNSETIFASASHIWGKRKEISHTCACFGSFIFCDPTQDRANNIFLVATAQEFHHGTSFVQVGCYGVSSSATPSAALVRRTVFIPSARFVFPTAPAPYVHCYIIQFLIMFFKFMIMLCLVVSTIELFMLDLIVFMIYLFWNLIMHMPNYLTSMHVQRTIQAWEQIKPSKNPSTNKTWNKMHFTWKINGQIRLATHIHATYYNLSLSAVAWWWLRW